ncbi:hypothetical protein EXN57_02055 [Clostridium botulinum]|nr:hypothetical protein [Clostridium botulinum]NFD33756.1 hypothetical protein [Clostridium botulinum]NFD57855.1 hypothetical protein [Clostridium botulinum]NFE00126.1 hypothetical protein [Clostridium botulinum]
MEKGYGNRIFEVKETVITQCQECDKEHNNPSLTYYVSEIDKVVCVDCAREYKNKELRLFVDMDHDVKAKIIKDWEDK